MPEHNHWRRSRSRSPWSCSLTTVSIACLAVVLFVSIVHAFLTRQLDPKGCDMCWSLPMYFKFKDFDTEHTRFASKYHLYLHREGSLDDDPTLKGVPVLFLPGNAGSYKQTRCLAFEAAQYYHSAIQQDSEALKAGLTSMDFFAIDFNEDFTAFHGQTVLDQAEYLNDAVAYILSLYHDSRRSQRDPNLPDPGSVILVGHSMGGVVARTMLTMPNYQPNTVNTIVTVSAPHARPPVSFDAESVRTYKHINDYWRQAYAQTWANDNPLWHVTLISIAGGGLDTVIPSDFASLESLVPSTHGFTVFTSAIPDVWTGCDHIQTTWCVQLLKSIVRSLFEILDVHRAGQTKPRAERMRIFRKWYLTGLEDDAEKTLFPKEPSTLLAIEDESNEVLPSGQRLIIRGLGRTKKAKTHLLPVPQQSKAGMQTFTLLSDSRFEDAQTSAPLEVLFCSIFPLQPGQASTLFSMNMALTGDTSGSTRLACKTMASDVIRLPASTSTSAFPYDKAQPFSYLQYRLEDLTDYHFVAVIDKAAEPSQGWVIAEFSDTAQSIIQTDLRLNRLLAFGLHHQLPAQRPLVTELRVPALHSSLLAFKLDLQRKPCNEDEELFTPLLRQHLDEPHESKYFVNVKAANISLHGIAPFMPPPMRDHATTNGLSLQFWSDPTCNSTMDISLKIDIPGSMGKLVMRYRVVFAAFPLVIVALVMRKQFQIYDESGVFITFAESLDLCLRSSLPVLILALTLLAASLTVSNAAPPSSPSTGLFDWGGNATESAIDFTKNDLLLGSRDPIFWFLVPLFSLICIGICVGVNYAALGLTNLFYLPYKYLTARPAWVRVEDVSGRSTAPAFAASSPRRRLITTCILLFLVSTFIPYQFAFLDAVLVQLSTCTRALRLVRETRTGAHYNFYNYAHSILILMIWILPINIPVLLVWAHNLAVHWLTPFSSHHNVLSIMPYLVLVETLTCGKMIPRITSRAGRFVTSALFFIVAVYAAVYGVTYAYALHHLVNFVCVWLLAVHFSGSEVSLDGLRQVLEGVGGVGEEVDNRGAKKRP
ncbi:GPI inositol deacylase [Lecanora helva]